jgi:hypothetical protein
VAAHVKSPAESAQGATKLLMQSNLSTAGINTVRNLLETPIGHVHSCHDGEESKFF